MDDRTKEILRKIDDAEYVLIGLGQDFDMEFLLESRPEYRKIQEKLQEENAIWLLPYVQEKFREEFVPKLEEELRQGLCNLAQVLEKKSYFVISSSTNRILGEAPWKKMLLKKERFVAPCGDWSKKQCQNRCEGEVQSLTREDQENLQQWFERMKKGKFSFPALGKCPKCGAPFLLNNVYAGAYDENGYLEEWTTYQSWLQNTLNHRMVLLEIGEGNRFPSIIRNPFQRIEMFQQKAELYNIDGEQNPIAWLLSLC